MGTNVFEVRSGTEMSTALSAMELLCHHTRSTARARRCDVGTDALHRSPSRAVTGCCSSAPCSPEHCFGAGVSASQRRKVLRMGLPGVRCQRGETPQGTNTGSSLPSINLSWEVTP